MTRPFLQRLMVLLAESSRLWTYFQSMFAPQRADTPLQVLNHHLIRRNNSTESGKTDAKGRKGLVGADGRQRQQPGEMLKGTYGANNTGPEQLDPTLAIMPALQTSNTLQTTYTVAIQATPSATSRGEESARVEIESLPWQNQNKPTTDGAKVEAPVLPGINQDTPNIGEEPKPVSPVAAANLSQPSGAPVIIVDKPLPGQNQEHPIMGELVLPPAPAVPAPASPPPPPPPLVTTLSVLSGASSTSSVHTIATSTYLWTSAASIKTSSITPLSSFTLLPATTFVMITRSEKGKEESPVTIAVSSTISTLPTSTSSTVTSGIVNATPQAIAAAQSFTGILSSTTAISAATLNPTIIPSNQDGSVLHPTARMLLILFIILGVLSILIAIIIFMMVRSHKKRSQTQHQSSTNQAPYGVSHDRIAATTYTSADTNDNPFLTASEKAIIDRAASSAGTSDVYASSMFSDAISLFIKKSRRLTYKISP